MIIISYIMIIITFLYTAYMQILNTQESKNIMELIELTNKRIDLLEAKREVENEQ